MNRPTIRDIAALSNCSPAAVSFALNGKPGVSEHTREKIIALAKEVGWTPNTAAQALASQFSNVIGLVISRPAHLIETEQFFFQFIIGLQKYLSDNDYALIFQTAPSISEEIAIWRTWWRQRRVDGVIVLDSSPDDARFSALKEIGLANIVVGDKNPYGSEVLTPDGEIMAEIANHLIDGGAKRIAYVSTAQNTTHAYLRWQSLSAVGREKDIEVMHATDFDKDKNIGSSLTQQLLETKRTPDAIIFDNEVLTLYGIETLHQYNKQIGSKIKIVSCEDAPFCEVLAGGISAVKSNAFTLGELAAQGLLSHIKNGVPTTLIADTPSVIIRGSSTD